MDMVIRCLVFIFSFIVSSVLLASETGSSYASVLNRGRYLRYWRAPETLLKMIASQEDVYLCTELKSQYEQGFSPLDYLLRCEKSQPPSEVNSAYKLALQSARIMNDHDLCVAIHSQWGAYCHRDKLYHFLTQRGLEKARVSFNDVMFKWIIPGDGKIRQKNINSDVSIVCKEFTSNDFLKITTKIYVYRKSTGVKTHIFTFEHTNYRSLFLLPLKGQERLAILYYNIVEPTVNVTPQSIKHIPFTEQLELYIVDLDNLLPSNEIKPIKVWDESFLREYLLKEFSWPDSCAEPVLKFIKPKDFIFKDEKFLKPKDY